METPTSRLHVAGILVLDPPEGQAPVADADDLATERFDAIRSVVGERVPRVPRLLRRPVRTPAELQRPVWVDEDDIDFDVHVHRASVEAPGGRGELDTLVGQVLSRSLPMDRPLWEMVVAGGLAAGRTAVIARLHHAILDGVSGATAMAALLDLAPGDGVVSVPAAAGGGGRAREAEQRATKGVPRQRALAVARGVAASIVHRREALVALLEQSADALIALNRQNHDLSNAGLSPPPALFSAPRTSLNGAVTGERRIATLSVPLADLKLVQRALGVGDGSVDRGRGATVNDVILAAVGGALRSYLASRSELPPHPLVAMVPVSTRGPASVPPSQRAQVGNYVSGMLVPLATTVDNPVERLRAVAAASSIAKRQESDAGGEFLETLLQVLPPMFVSGCMRAVGRFALFDRLPPPVNVVVSSVVVPDVSLWLAGCPVSAIYPAGPVADGVGLNVTSMTYKGTVHFGLVACPRLVPDVFELAVLLDDALAELVVAALDMAR